MKQAQDFHEEQEVLAAVLNGQPDTIFDARTQFKGWTVNDVLGHLHFFNAVAEAALSGAEAFDAMVGPKIMDLAAGGQILEMQYAWLDGLSGRALFAEWREGAGRLAAACTTANPKARIKWFGPGMSVLSAITARQMETWAHGQEIFDLLGVQRKETDRIRNIAHLGVATFGWSYQVRGLAVPTSPPYVVLTAPSGDIWRWNEPQDTNRVEGSAVEFAQVVTQVRNLADTQVRTTHGTAHAWMLQAQCFAGPPATPPAPGSRFRNPDALSPS
ncbi:TIGR03084 family metal-binding protein [Phaeobacter sp. B1627]|uniref:TIGR03084 family metal-binding protein n=1 Tax=Phaeobacter sp. B1627 TaxID=2583809 RepID=UPI0011195A6E|nr:TIGR03084 family metal-binding protein [Phaeobacter sp. B1627]TNJ42079.1 TIGR03084 family protein [Phaeobacter sp. B1627]